MAISSAFCSPAISRDASKNAIFSSSEEHPEDAIAVDTQQLEPTLRLPDKCAYEEAVELLRKVRDLMVQVEKADDFGALVESVRAYHKPRLNFMRLLDAEGWK